MKRAERVSTIIQILRDNPGRHFTLGFFCKKFSIGKSSISEDLNLADASVRASGCGFLEVSQGPKGGVRFVPDISDEEVCALRRELAGRLSEKDRELGGGFRYTSDIFFDYDAVEKIALYFSKVFRDRDADCVVTLETKGIPLAFLVAKNLNLPLAVARREAHFSEGSTVSINYFSGPNDTINIMSMSKRAVREGSKVLVIDDFMRRGGTIVGLINLLREFNCLVAGVGVAFTINDEKEKRIQDYVALVEI